MAAGSDAGSLRTSAHHCHHLTWFPERDARKRGRTIEVFCSRSYRNALRNKGNSFSARRSGTKAQAPYSYGVAPALLLVSPVEVARKCPEVGTVLTLIAHAENGPVAESANAAQSAAKCTVHQYDIALPPSGPGRLPGLPKRPQPFDGLGALPPLPAPNKRPP